MFLDIRTAVFKLTFISLTACLPSSASSKARGPSESLAGASDNGNKNNAIFDYIIVGGGNAGLTLAARLSESPTTRVAVIEAGGFYEDPIGCGSQLSIPGWQK